MKHESFEALAPLNRTLGELDDRISTSIRTVEDALRLRISTRITTPLPDGPLLVFGKQSGAWKLLVEQPTGEVSPLTGCSRERRVAVFAGGHIEQLIRDAKEQIEHQIADRERALAAATVLLAALGGE